MSLHCLGDYEENSELGFSAICFMLESHTLTGQRVWSRASWPADGLQQSRRITAPRYVLYA